MMKTEIKRIIQLIIAIFIIILGLVFSSSNEDRNDEVFQNIRFFTTINDVQVCFKPWYCEKEDTVYLILPSTIKYQKKPLKVLYESEYRLTLDGDILLNKSEWYDSYKENCIQMRITDNRNTVVFQKNFQVLYSENIPTLFVNTGTKEMGEMYLFDENGQFLTSDILKRFRVRGNLTATLSKKPYSMITNQSHELLGMESAKGWNLLANATDGSNLRNKIVLDWANELSDNYQPQGEFVELYLNGEYQGLYLLTEKVEVGKNRLDISPETCRFLMMEIEFRTKEEEEFIVTERGHYFVEEPTRYLSQEDKNGLLEYLNDIESALYAPDGKSEISGRYLEQLIDFDSWADAWLLEEVSSDHDLGITSQYAYIEDWKTRSILKAGPVWDFDGTFGNAMVSMFRNPYALVTNQVDVKGPDNLSQNRWLAPMYNNHANFREILIQKYIEKISPYIYWLMDEGLEQYSEKIHRASTLNALRWLDMDNPDYFAAPENFHLREIEGYQKYDVLDQHVDMISQFLAIKNVFLYQLWVEKADFEIEIEERNDYDGTNRTLQYNIYKWIRIS